MDLRGYYLSIIAQAAEELRGLGVFARVCEMPTSVGPR